MKKFVTIWIAFVLFCLTNTARASTEVEPGNQIDSTRFHQLQRELVYTDSAWTLTLRDWNLFKNKKSDPAFNAPSFANLSNLFNTLIYLIIIVLVGVLLYTFVRDYQSFKVDKKVSKSNFDLDEIEDIAEVDFESALKDALAKNDFRLAIRIQYLMSLQKLTSKGYITWAKDKTNRHYVQEVKKFALHPYFTNSSRVFEYIWYGNIELDKLRYESYTSIFDQLNSNV